VKVSSPTKTQGRRPKAVPSALVAPELPAEELPAPVLQMLQERFGNAVVWQALQGGGGALGELLAMATAHDAEGQGMMAQTMLSNSAMQRALHSHLPRTPQAEEGAGTALGVGGEEDVPQASSPRLMAGAPGRVSEGAAEERSSSSAAPASSASGVSAPSGEPSPEAADEVAAAYQALAPSAQPPATAALSPALTQASDQQQEALQATLPALEATLPGEPETAHTPVAPPPVQVEPVALYNTAPALVAAVPAPAPAAVLPVDLSAVFHHTDEGNAWHSAQAIGTTLGALTQTAPVLDTTVPPPEIELVGEADPTQLQSITEGAVLEAEQVQQEAALFVTGLQPQARVAPLPLSVPVALPALAQPEPLPALPTVDGMLELQGYALAAPDQQAFDAAHGPQMQAELAAATDALAATEAEFVAGHGELVADTELQQAQLSTDAATAQQQAVGDAHGQMAEAQQETWQQQQAATTDALDTLGQQQTRVAADIDAQVVGQTAAIATVQADAQAAADAELATAQADASARQQQAQQRAEEESWWDMGIDAWQALVQAVADEITALWEVLTARVAQILEEAVAQAALLAEQLVAYVAEALSAYYDLWRFLIETLVGDIFPELAQWLLDRIDEIEALALSLLQRVAEGLVAALEALAAAIVAGMNALLLAYRAGVAMYLSLWESIQQGQWQELGTMLLTALLEAAGIDPSEFFAIFTNLEEIEKQLLEDPGSVVRNGAAALGLGFEQFGENFLDHFIGASVEWLTGAIGLDMPDSFDLAGIFDVTCQVLGLTYEHLREKAVEHVGEDAVTAAETLYDGMMALLDGGWGGLWDYVKGELDSLVDDVVLAIGTWLLEKAVLVVGRWVVGLFATAGLSSILELLIAGWQMLMWCIDQFHAMYALVQSTVQSVHDFVMGDVQPAADKIEGTLHGLIAPTIDLVAKLLNISNISDKVQSIIESVREMIDNAIDQAFVTVMGGLGLKSATEAEGEQGEGEGTFDGELGEELSFTAAGEGHRLWVEDTQVMVASTPMPVPDRLAGWRARLGEAPSAEEGQGGPTDRAAAEAALQEAERHLETLEGEVNEAVVEVEQAQDESGTDGAGQAEQAAEADAAVEAAERPLATVLAELFALFLDEAPAAEPCPPLAFGGADGQSHVFAVDGSGRATVDGGSAEVVLRAAEIAVRSAPAAVQTRVAAATAEARTYVRTFEATLARHRTGEDASTLPDDQELAAAALAEVTGQPVVVDYDPPMPVQTVQGTSHSLAVSETGVTLDGEALPALLPRAEAMAVSGDPGGHDFLLRQITALRQAADALTATVTQMLAGGESAPDLTALQDAKQRAATAAGPVLAIVGCQPPLQAPAPSQEPPVPAPEDAVPPPGPAEQMPPSREAPSPAEAPAAPPTPTEETGPGAQAPAEEASPAEPPAEEELSEELLQENPLEFVAATGEGGAEESHLLHIDVVARQLMLRSVSDVAARAQIQTGAFEDKLTLQQLAEVVGAVEKVEAQLELYDRGDPDPKKQRSIRASCQETIKRIERTEITPVLRQAGFQDFPLPDVGTHRAMTALAQRSKTPDGLTRESHHVPGKELAKVMGELLVQRGEALLSRALGEEAEHLEVVGNALLERGRGTLRSVGEDGFELSAILVHADTHKAAPEPVVSIHSAEIAEETERVIQEREAALDTTFLRVMAGKNIAVNPQGSHWRVQLQEAWDRTVSGATPEERLSWEAWFAQTEAALELEENELGPALERATQGVYDRVYAESFASAVQTDGARVQAALARSTVDGPAEQSAAKMAKVDEVEALALTTWRPLLTSGGI
jgi:hypothetical protein